MSTPDTTVPGRPGATLVIECDWTGFRATDDDANRYNDITGQIVEIINVITGGDFVITITYYSEGGVLHRWNAAWNGTGRFEKHQIAECSGATHPGSVVTGDWRWVGTSPPDPAILIKGATKKATEPITAPAPSLSPADSSAVNLGMWLAVQPAGPISVRAELGTVWAETTATVVSTSFDPGNGDEPVVCAGHGTPIPEDKKDSIEQGPCGYTYTSDTDGEPIEFTITSTWTVTWRLSDGRTGSEPDIVRTTVLPYEVYEIQTVGTDG